MTPQVYLFGPVHQMLKKIRSSCVFCLKQKCERYEPQIKFDNFKTSTIRPWSSISIDMWGHFLTSDQPRQTTRRIYKKKYVLGVIDNSGLAALNLIPMADASTKSFCTALMTHFAETNVVASEIYSDCGTNFLAVARQENNNSNNNNNNSNNNNNNNNNNNKNNNDNNDNNNNQNTNKNKNKRRRRTTTTTRPTTTTTTTTTRTRTT